MSIILSLLTMPNPTRQVIRAALTQCAAVAVFITLVLLADALVNRDPLDRAAAAGTWARESVP